MDMTLVFDYLIHYAVEHSQNNHRGTRGPVEPEYYGVCNLI